MGPKPMLTFADVRKVTPALEAYTRNRLLGDVWKRPGLAPRDRSIVTLAALIARNQTIEMSYHLNLALIAITESLNGKNVDWMEKVSDAQYRG